MPGAEQIGGSDSQPLKDAFVVGVNMDRHEKIDYVELPAKDMDSTKEFFSALFGWSFTSYGPDYMDCHDGGITMGFFRADLKASPQSGSALVTFYSNDLEATLSKVDAAGGKITKPIISFPGGRRFQFTEPSGGEFAVWSDQNLEESHEHRTEGTI